MINEEVKMIVAETVKEYVKRQPPQKPHKMEFSKKLMIVTSVIYALSWIMAAYSLFVKGEIPFELLQYANILYGASVVSYCGKTAYENKAKIDKWGGDGV